MTEPNGNKNAPTGKPPVQGTRELSANRQDGAPNARWRVRTLGVAGACILSALTNAKCGGSGQSNDPVLPDIPLPAGVCQNIDSRVTPVGVTGVSLNEAILDETAPNNKVKLGNDTYRLQVLEINMDGADSDVKVIITDSAGNPVAFLEDQNGDRTANVNYLEAGDSWTFILPDGRHVTVTVCAIYEDLEGKQHVVLYSDGFDWCTSVDHTVRNTDDYETVTYGTQDISRILHEVGERADRDDAECMELVREIEEETTTLEVPMAPGVQPEDSRVKILGELWEVIELNASGEILLGKSIVSGPVETGERLITGVDNLELLVTEVANYDGTYKANLVVSVPGFELELVEGAVAGTLVRVSLPSGDVYVRVNEVNADGTVKLEVLGQTRTMEDHGTWTKGETEYGVSLDAEGSNVAGWMLTKQ